MKMSTINHHVTYFSLQWPQLCGRKETVTVRSIVRKCKSLKRIQKTHGGVYFLSNNHKHPVQNYAKMDGSELFTYLSLWNSSNASSHAAEVK